MPEGDGDPVVLDGAERSLAPSSGPSPIGSLDGVDAQFRLGGWAWLPGSNTQLVIELLEGDTVAERVVAGSFRPDLLAAGIGDGHHGFQTEMPDVFFDGAYHTFSLRVAAADGGMPIGVPCRVVLPRRGWSQAPRETAQSILVRALTTEADERRSGAHAAALAGVVRKLAERFGDSTGIDLLHIYAFGRVAEADDLAGALARLAESPGDYGPVVEQVLRSEELSSRYGPHALECLAPVEVLAGWLELA